MMIRTSRREFVKSSVTVGACAAGGRGILRNCLLAAPRSAEQTLPEISRPGMFSFKKGLVYDMLPSTYRHADRFKLARDAGFEVVQAPTTPDEREAEEIKNAADNVNIRIDSVMNIDHWQYPLSSTDPAVVERSLAGMRTSLHNAKFWGSDAVLLVPAL